MILGSRFPGTHRGATACPVASPQTGCRIHTGLFPRPVTDAHNGLRAFLRRRRPAASNSRTTGWPTPREILDQVRDLGLRAPSRDPRYRFVIPRKRWRRDRVPGTPWGSLPSCSWEGSWDERLSIAGVARARSGLFSRLSGLAPQAQGRKLRLRRYVPGRLRPRPSAHPEFLKPSPKRIWHRPRRQTSSFTSL